QCFIVNVCLIVNKLSQKNQPLLFNRIVMKKNQISPWVIISSFINLFKNLKNTLLKFQFDSLLNLSLIQLSRFPLLTAISTSIKANTLWAYNFIATSKEWKPRFGEKCTQMIYNTILASVLLLFISSCAKDPVGPTDGQSSNDGEYLISFTIDGFTQDLLPFSNKIQAYGLNATTSRNSNSSLFSNSIQNTEEQTDIRDFINTIEIKVYRGRD